MLMKHDYQGFYNPTSDQFVEPSHPGISYSFTDDGYYEEAYYRAIADRTSFSFYMRASTSKAIRVFSNMLHATR